jgi:hypothetical protein
MQPALYKGAIDCPKHNRATRTTTQTHKHQKQADNDFRKLLLTSSNINP